MDDYIKRLTALKAFINVEELYDPEQGNKRFSMTDIEKILNSVEPVDVRPTKSGEWIIKYSVYLQSGEIMASCSLCNNKLRILGNLSDFNFCPNCGAKMNRRYYDWNDVYCTRN